MKYRTVSPWLINSAPVFVDRWNSSSTTRPNLVLGSLSSTVDRRFPHREISSRLFSLNRCLSTLPRRRRAPLRFLSSSFLPSFRTVSVLSCDVHKYTSRRVNLQTLAGSPPCHSYLPAITPTRLRNSTPPRSHPRLARTSTETRRSRPSPRRRAPSSRRNT